MDEQDDFYPEQGLYSDCCGALSLGEVFTDTSGATGICSNCRDHASFSRDPDEE